MGLYMEDETETLVEEIERVGRADDEREIVVRARTLGNWQSSKEDCDLELGIGAYAHLGRVLQVIGADPNWTVRWVSTGDPPHVTSDGHHVSIALIYCGSLEVDGTIWFDDLFSDST